MLQLFLTICMSLLKKVNLEVAGWRLHLSSSAQAPLKYTSSQALSSVIRGIQREQPARCCMICIKPITHPAKLSHFNVKQPKPLLYWPRVFPGALNPPERCHITDGKSRAPSRESRGGGFPGRLCADCSGHFLLVKPTACLCKCSFWLLARVGNLKSASHSTRFCRHATSAEGFLPLQSLIPPGW